MNHIDERTVAPRVVEDGAWQPVRRVRAAARPELSIYAIRPAIDGLLVGATGLFSALGSVLAKRLIRPPWSGAFAPINWGRVNRLDRNAIGLDSDALDVASYVLTAGAIGAPLLIEIVALGRRKPLFEEVLVYAETILFTTAIDTLTKYISQRPLPRVRAFQSLHLARKPGGYRSFESGHVSMAVGSLTVASITAKRRYGARAWPWTVTIAAGFAIAAARIGAGRHYITDALVGALSGAAVGVIVSRAHLRRGPGRAEVTVPR